MMIHKLSIQRLRNKFCMVIGKLSMSFHLNRILQHRYYNHSMSYKSNKDFRNLYIILHPSSSYLTHIQYNRLRNCK